VSTINGVFLSLSLLSSPRVTFLAEGVIVVLWNFELDFKQQQKIRFGVKNEMGRKLMRTFFKFYDKTVPWELSNFHRLENVWQIVIIHHIW
jgi:hypothetical protein